MSERPMPQRSIHNTAALAASFKGRASIRLSALVALGGVLLVPAAAWSQLWLDANFDHGSLLAWSGDLNTINLAGRSNYYGSNRWRWMYFKAAGVDGAQPTFVINQNFAGAGSNDPHKLRDHPMVYSYDNENWSFFDNNQLVSTGPDHFRFSNNTPFTQNEVYVAYAIPYSYGRSVAHTRSVLASPWAMPTASASRSGVIGQAPPGTDDLGRSVPPTNLYAYRITNPATDSPTEAKRKIMISSGLHSGETLGTYAYEGMVNWLISDDPRAARLRDIAEVFAYPVLNPSGRYAGMSRTTVTNPNRDPNGLWDPSRWQNNSSVGCPGTTACRDIRFSGEAMLADVNSTPGGLDAFIDFHSTVPAYTSDGVTRPGVEEPPEDFGFIDINGGKANADWWVELRTLQPNMNQWQTGLGNFTTAGYARRILGAAVDVTFETQFGWERNIDYYHQLGANFGIAFYNAWVPQVDGDFNGDGVVDAADYVVWRDGLGTTSTHADYDLWKSNFAALAGTGVVAGSSTHTAVPEPASLLLLIVAGVLMLGLRTIERTAKVSG